MADFVRALPVPARLREPLRRALADGGRTSRPPHGGGRDVRPPWPELTEDEVRALVEHGVAPLVYRVAHLAPLREEAIRAAVVEPARFDDLHAVLAALAAQGVVALLMKGTALAYDIYPAPELRPRGDTDFLIARETLDALREAMRILGFTEILSSGDELGVRQATFTRTDRFGFEHAYDVHWDVTNTPVFSGVLRFDELRTRARALPHGMLAFSHVDALLLACIHRVAHHHDSERLIWLYDIALLRERMTREEHERFWRLAAERRVAGVCIRSIEVADEWCGRAPHARAEELLTREEIERDEPSRVFLDRDITYGRMMLSDLRALPWRSRLRRLWQLALPPAAFMQQSFPERSRMALPWLYVLRGARGVRRLFRRV
ncbi:MAG TPA: nucleotidyltransferase family protein [Thermoanaerobaculia bacterium]|nr:nucleotidyltransferase family protein [Thermoanaerobaculia bacterium]